MKRIFSVFLAILSVCPAYAQYRNQDNAVAGTYLKSCSGCRLINNTTLRCDSCYNGRARVRGELGRTQGGDWETNLTLNLTPCPSGPVWNDKGRLRCGPG
jgi:hypothetical protein